MKFHLFEIKYQDDSGAQGLLRRIDDLARKKMGDRELPVNGKTVALEMHEKISHRNGEMHLIDVMDASSTDLPGRYTPEKKNEDMPLNEGDQSSQQTMALYVPTRNRDYLICQYNHFGIRASMIFTYFGVYRDIYQLNPVVNGETHNIFRQSNSVRKLRVKIATTEQMTAELANVPMLNAIQDGMNLDAGYIELTFSHGTENSSFSDNMKGVVESLLSAFSTKTDNIPKIEATVKRQLDAPPEVLDLFGQRVSHEEPDGSLVKTKGGRYDYPSRKKAIINALKTLIAQNHIEGR